LALKEFFNDFKDLDAILSNQIVRYRTGFKLILIILIISLLVSVITSIYMLTMLTSAMDLVNKRGYIVLTDNHYVEVMGNTNRKYYFKNIALNLSKNFLSIVPENSYMNSEYIKDYSTNKEVIEGYYSWLSDRVNYLNTIKAFSVFIPYTQDIKDYYKDKGFYYEIVNKDTYEKNGIIDVAMRIDGRLYYVSALKPISTDYTVILSATIDNSRKMLNQSGINIYSMNIYETNNYMDMLNAEKK
jgi:hypothetical protein